MRKYLLFDILILLIFFGTGCARYKNMVLFDGLTQQQSFSVPNTDTLTNHTVIKENYRLFISFNGLNFSHYQAFNNVNSNGNINNISLYLNSYLVDSKGNIAVPVLGKIYVGGLTIEKAEQEIQNRTNEYFKDVQVAVRLLNFEISMLGEVKAPNQYLFYKEKINIVEALSRAGGLTSTADLSKIIVLRKKEGFTESYVLDLTDKNEIATEGYWLEPNDIVYVKPLKIKALQVNATSISILLSGITTMLLFLTYFSK